MTTEAEKDQQEAQDEAAGFEAGFSGEAQQPVKAAEPAKEPEPVVKQAEPVVEAAPQAPIPLSPEEIAAFRSTAAELPMLKTQLRDAHGRIGALTDLLNKTREQKKDEGKAPVLTAVELKRIKEHYPEMAEFLGADIGEVLAAIKPAAVPSPEDIAALVNKQMAEVGHAERKQMVADEHPDWENIKKGEDLWKWVATLPPAEAQAFQTSANPVFISKKLDTFKAWLAAQTKAKDKSQERLEAAITPQGVPRQGKQTISDDEAMQKGFEEGFNS